MSVDKDINNKLETLEKETTDELDSIGQHWSKAIDKVKAILSMERNTFTSVINAQVLSIEERMDSMELQSAKTYKNIRQLQEKFDDFPKRGQLLHLN